LPSSVTSLEVFQGTEIPAYPSTSNEGIVDEVSDWHEAIKEDLFTSTSLEYINNDGCCFSLNL